jgi:hypothetical protein
VAALDQDAKQYDENYGSNNPDNHYATHFYSPFSQ